jgi:hypothetical protein
MALYFPDTPAVDDVFNNGIVQWIWDGVKWTGGGANVVDMSAYLPLAGGTMTGPLAVSPSNLQVDGGATDQILTTDGNSNLAWQGGIGASDGSLLAVLSVDGAFAGQMAVSFNVTLDAEL